MGNTARVYTANYSVSDWELWHDRWELINGMPYSMSPMPSFRHQEIANVLGALLYNQIKTPNCKHCKVTQPIDWQISEDTVVQPDLLVICKPLTGKRFNFPPELVFEILSPATEQKDRNDKFRLYEEQRVPYYTLIDAENEVFEIYELNASGKYELRKSLNSFTYKIGECQILLVFEEVFNS